MEDKITFVAIINFMKKLLGILLLVAIWFSQNSCNQKDWQQTASGLAFRVILKGKGPEARMGTIVKIRYERVFNDSTVFSNFQSMPTYVNLIPGLFSGYGPEEVLLYHIKEGDSLELVQRADSLISKGILHTPLREGITSRDQWITKVKVVKVFEEDLLHASRKDSLVLADKSAEKNKWDAYYRRYAKEQIEKYMQNNHITSNPEILSTKKDGKGTNYSDTTKHLISLQIRSLNKTLFFSRDSLPYQKGRSGLPLSIDTSLFRYGSGTHLTYYLSAMDAFGSESPMGIPAYTNLIFEIVVK